MELAQDLPPSCRSLIKNKQITNECRLIAHLRLWVGFQECPLTRHHPLKKQHRVRWLPFVSQLSGGSDGDGGDHYFPSRVLGGTKRSTGWEIITPYYH